MSNSKRGKKHYLDDKSKGNGRALKIREEDNKFSWKEFVDSRFKEIEEDEKGVKGSE